MCEHFTPSRGDLFQPVYHIFKDLEHLCAAWELFYSSIYVFDKYQLLTCWAQVS